MSIDQKYLQDQINALLFSVSQLTNTVNCVVNTNGALNNVLSGLYGTSDELHKKYLMSYAELVYRDTRYSSSKALLKLLTTPNLRSSFVNEVREVIFKKSGHWEVKSSNKVSINSNDQITITVEINGVQVSSTFEVHQLVKEDELVSIYEKLFDVNKKVVYNELGSMLNDFTKYPDQGTLNTDVFNEIFKDVLVHQYVLKDYYSAIVVDLDDGLNLTLTWEMLRSHGYYKYKMSVDRYIGLVKDVETIRGQYDEIIETYCTRRESEGD